VAYEELKQYEELVGRNGLSGAEREMLEMYEQHNAISEELRAHRCIDGSDAPYVGVYIMIGCVMGYSLKWWNGRKGE
jgi:hypothetical protein